MSNSSRDSSMKQGSGKSTCFSWFGLRHSIRIRIVALCILLVVLAGGAVGVSLINISRNTIRANVLQSNGDRASLAADLISLYVSAIQSHARVFALRPDIARAVSDRETAQAQIALEQFVEIQRGLNGAGVYDINGIQLLYSDPLVTTIGQSLADRDWFQQVLATGQPYLGTPTTGRSSGAAIMTYAVPIMDGRGQLLGVLSSSLSLAKLSDALGKVELGADSRASITDSRNGGIIIAHSDASRILTPISGRNEATRRVLAGEKGAIETTSSSGEIDLVGFSPVPGLPWGVLVVTPSGSALGSVQALTRNTLMITGLIVLMGVLLGLFLALSLTNSLRRLVKGTEEIGRGNLDYEVSTKKEDEIGELSRSFGRMVQEMKTTLVSRNKLAQEIVERKKAEESLNEAQLKYRDLYENAPVAYYSIGMDARVGDSNKAAQVWLGYTAEELTGKDRLELYAPECRAKAKALFEIVRSGGRARDEEMVYLKKNGDKVTGLLSSSAVVDSSGTIISFRSIAVDITERLKAQSKMAQLAKEWSTTFDSIADPVSIIDRDLRIVRANKAFVRFFGSDSEALEGKEICQLILGSAEPCVDCPAKQTFATGRPAAVEIMEAGSGRWLQVSTSPILDDKGNVTGIVHVARDISDMKKAHEQAMVRDRLASIGELTAGIAHEINNPLTSVLGFSEMILDRNDLTADVRADMETIHKGAQRATAIVKNLLSFARSRQETKQLVDLEKDILTVLEMRAYETKVNNIKVRVNIPPDLPRPLGSSFQLQQVFLNIIVNAEYFMRTAHQGGNLTITAAQAGDMVRVTFADDGPGIPKGNMARLFSPFFTTKGVGKGTGLGLSICHGIITEHGGRIYAESIPGKGAAFTIELPIEQAAGESSRSAQKQPETGEL